MLFFRKLKAMHFSTLRGLVVAPAYKNITALRLP